MLGRFFRSGHEMSYGLSLALAIFVAARVFGSELARRGLGTWRDVTLLCWLTLPIALLGAKLGGILDAPELFLEDPLKFLVDPREHAFFGALLSGLAVFCLYFRASGRSPVACLDALALALPVSYALGRVGCFVSGCCHGRVSSLPWACRPPGFEVSVHPTQIYEALFAVATYVMLWSLRDAPRRPGALFMLYLSTYAASRFLVEWIRVNPRHGGLSQAQWQSLGLLAICALAWCTRAGADKGGHAPRPAADRWGAEERAAD